MALRDARLGTGACVAFHGRGGSGVIVAAARGRDELGGPPTAHTSAAQGRRISHATPLRRRLAALGEVVEGRPHACAKEVADRLLAGDPFRPSRNDWDWLGAGVYFWEFGHQRAHDWAHQWPRLHGRSFAVVGAIGQLGNCLDLLDTDHTRRLAEFAARYVADGGVVPANSGAKRLGDCFLVNDYCERMKKAGQPFDTVRGLFQEGDPIIAGSEIRLENHIQIVARRPEAIVGLFRPRDYTRWAPAVALEPSVGQADAGKPAWEPM